MKLNIVKSAAFALASVTAVLGTASCDDSTKYEVSSGQPVIKYIITTDKAASDSIISSAYTESVICIVGDNLRSTKKAFFNDREAVLSPSFINNHTLILSVPSSLPDDITNKIYLHGENGKVVEYPFTVLAPGPSISSIGCEFVKPGELATLYGNYFVDNATTPLTVTLPDGQTPTITKFSQTELSFIVPDNFTASGQVQVTTAYGEGKSSFHLNDDRNIVVDFDGSHGGNANGNGWRCGDQHKHKTGDYTQIPAIDGDFLFFAGSLDEDGGWNDNEFEYDIWVDGNMAALNTMPKFAAMLNNNAIGDLCVKFECYVPKDHPWSSGGLNLIWMGDQYGNGPHADASYPRGVWSPWADAGEFHTDNKWITVTIPLSDFNRDNRNQKIGATVDNADFFKGLTLFVLNGSPEDAKGKACSPWIAIDNIRVVPNK